MNINIILEILELTLSIAEAQLENAPPQNLKFDQTLVAIIQKAAEAYQLHTGEPLDLSLIQPETTS